MREDRSVEEMANEVQMRQAKALSERTGVRPTYADLSATSYGIRFYRSKLPTISNGDAKEA